MARISATRVRGFLSQGDNATTSHGKGRALEDLVCYLFEKVPGISVTRRNTMNSFQTEEIDVAFWNERAATGFYFLPDVLLVECKNWSSPVNSTEVAWFDRKIKDRGLDFGILVATNGITGDTHEIARAHALIAGALAERRRLVVVTRMEIEALQDSDDLVTLVKEKICELAVAGRVF